MTSRVVLKRRSDLKRSLWLRASTVDDELHRSTIPTEDRAEVADDRDAGMRRYGSFSIGGIQVGRTSAF